MAKYIDAEKLEKLIDNLEPFSCISEEQDGFYSAISRVNDIIYSLQQEQQAVEGVVHHVMNAHYIVTNQKQLNARLREIPEGTKVNIIIYEIKEEEK